MSHEFLRMQKLSGVITESEYNQKIEELNSAESSTETLNENVVGVGGTMNPYPAKKKEVYESAFNKFLGEEMDDMREEKEEMEEMGMRYEEPVDEAKEELEEDEKTRSQERGYQDGFKDAIKDALDALEKVKGELKKGERDKGDEVDQAEENGYQDGFADAIRDADKAIAKLRKELKEEEQLDEVPADRYGSIKTDDDKPEKKTERERDGMKARKLHKGPEKMDQFV